MAVQRSRASKSLLVVGFTIGCCIISCISFMLQPGFVSGYRAGSRTVNVGRADGALRKEIPKWQNGLDTAYFDHTASPLKRIQGLSTYFSEDGNVGIVKKVIVAISILHEKGAAGSREALDLLFPKGLHLRADVDAILDVVEKVGPQGFVRELEKLRDELKREGVNAPQELAEFAESISERILPVGVEQASDRASDIFRKLPRAKADEIEYIVIYKHRDFEVRAYQPFGVAKTSIKGDQESVADVFASSLKGEKTSVGESFMSIVESVQKQQGAVKVLMPIITDFKRNEKSPTGMALSLDVPDYTKVFPDSLVTYSKANMQLVAVRTFLGIASDLEVRDQYEALKKAVIADGVYDFMKDGAYSLMQYNAPRMMPWRRRSEIGIPIKPPKQ